MVRMGRRRMRWREGVTDGSRDGGLTGGEGDGQIGRLPCRGEPPMALRGQSGGKEGQCGRNWTEEPQWRGWAAAAMALRLGSCAVGTGEARPSEGE
jgi:hypothetical protein